MSRLMVGRIFGSRLMKRCVSRGERCERVGGRRDGDRIGAEVEAGDVGIEARQISFGQAAVGGIDTVERVGGMTARIEADQAECGAVAGADEVAGLDTFGGQLARELFAEHIARHAGQQGGRGAETRKADGDIVRRAAGAGFERDAGIGAAVTDENVEQGFTTDEEHQAASGVSASAGSLAPVM
jgi:hypothetical protein